MSGAEKATKFVNASSRTVCLALEGGSVELPPPIRPATVVMRRVGGQRVRGIRVSVDEVVGVQNLPDPEEGTVYIVDYGVLPFVDGGRTDVCAVEPGAPSTFDPALKRPSTSSLVRIERGDW
jgi:hypothetical protein